MLFAETNGVGPAYVDNNGHALKLGAGQKQSLLFTTTAAKQNVIFTSHIHCDTTVPSTVYLGLIMKVLAQFERDLLIELTQSGLKRAKAEGAVFGRPTTLDAGQRNAVLAGLAEGASVSELAKQHSTSRQTIMRVRDAALPDARAGSDRLASRYRAQLGLPAAGAVRGRLRGGG